MRHMRASIQHVRQSSRPGTQAGPPCQRRLSLSRRIPVLSRPLLSVHRHDLFGAPEAERLDKKGSH
jgi:hypothetical protein